MNFNNFSFICILVAALIAFIAGKLEQGILWLILSQLILITEKLGDKNGTTN